MATTAVTLNGLESHSPVTQAFSNGIRRAFVQHFTRFNWQCARTVPLH